MEKQLFSFLLRILPKNYLLALWRKIKKMETMAGKNFKLIWDNDLKHESNLAKEFY